MKIKTINLYKSSDGSAYSDRVDAVAQELKIMANKLLPIVKGMIKDSKSFSKYAERVSKLKSMTNEIEIFITDEVFNEDRT